MGKGSRFYPWQIPSTFIQKITVISHLVKLCRTGWLSKTNVRSKVTTYLYSPWDYNKVIRWVFFLVREWVGWRIRLLRLSIVYILCKIIWLDCGRGACDVRTNRHTSVADVRTHNTVTSRHRTIRRVIRVGSSCTHTQTHTACAHSTSSDFESWTESATDLCVDRW